MHILLLLISISFPKREWVSVLVLIWAFTEVKRPQMGLQFRCITDKISSEVKHFLIGKNPIIYCVCYIKLPKVLQESCNSKNKFSTFFSLYWLKCLSYVLTYEMQGNVKMQFGESQMKWKQWCKNCQNSCFILLCLVGKMLSVKKAYL